MQLEEKEIREFSDLWYQEFGERLSPDEACHAASQLMELYYLLARSSAETKPESGESSEL
jgi:hypothetical protein